MALQLDITQPGEIAAAIAAATERFGAIDVLVNNAGYGQLSTIEDTPIDAVRAIFETNVIGAFAMIKAVLGGMRRRRSGQIVNIGSVAGLIGFPALTAYCASKFALVGLTEALCAEVRHLDIKVTVAELGPFATNFTNAMAMTMPSEADYDLGSLSQAAGTAHWGAGDDPQAGVAALDDPVPPIHLILGRPGIEVVPSYDAIRQAERTMWQTP